MSDTYRSGPSGPAGASYTVTAMFDNRTDAQEAVDALIEEGFGHDDVRLLPGKERDVDRDPEVRRSQGSDDPGFWASLRGLFLPDDDSTVYAEGLRRGGYLVTVRTTSANHDRAIDILDDEGTIDLDERAQSWRTEGWTGATAAGAPRTGAMSGATGAGATGPSGTRRVRVSDYPAQTPVSEQADLRRTAVNVQDDRDTKGTGTGTTGRDTEPRSR